MREKREKKRERMIYFRFHVNQLCYKMQLSNMNSVENPMIGNRGVVVSSQLSSQPHAYKISSWFL